MASTQDLQCFQFSTRFARFQVHANTKLNVQGYLSPCHLVFQHGAYSNFFLSNHCTDSTRPLTSVGWIAFWTCAGRW